MSLARPARSLLVGRCIGSGRTRSPAPSRASPVSQCLQFHSSSQRSSKKRSQFRNVKASELGLTKPENMKAYQAEKFADYTKEELEQLKKKYSPEQMAALEAGEKAIDPEDMIWQGRLRDDMFRPEYLEDYTTLDPRYDLKPETKVRADEPHFPTEEEDDAIFLEKMTRLAEKTSNDQLSRSMLRAIRKVKESQGEEMIDLTFEELDDLERDPEMLKRYLEAAEKPDEEIDMMEPNETNKDQFLTRAKAKEIDDLINKMWQQEVDQISKSDNFPYLTPSNVDILADAPDAVDPEQSALQPDLGKIPGVEGYYRSASDEDPDDPTGQFQHAKLVSGLTKPEISNLLIKTLVIRHVSNQTRLGKVRSASIIVMAGNGNGRFGIGHGKSTQMETATMAATALAVRSMVPIRRYENRTVFGNITGKVSGTVVNMSARPPGFGLRVPHRFYEMCRGIGIYDLAINMPRSKNPMNSVKAAFKALVNQPDPEEIAIGRGKKLVDARKVYYGGSSR